MTGVDDAAPATATDGAVARRPGAVRRLAELLALSGFVVAQPILDVTADSPEFFLYRRPSATEMRLLVVLVAFGPALGLWAAERAAGLVRRRAEPVVHAVFVAGLCAVLAVQVGKQTGLVEGVPLGVLAVPLGAAVAAIALRSSYARQALVYAAPAPLVFLLMFTLTTPAGALVRPGRPAGTSAAVAANRPPIVVVVLDELPARALLDAKGDIDRRLFPNFARLAARTTRYPNANAVTGYTQLALPSLVTGRDPERRAAPSFIDFPDNLFTLLGRSYRIESHESISQLCPPSLCSDEEPQGRRLGFLAMIKDVLRVGGEIVSPYPAPEDTFESFADAVVADAGDRPIADKYDLGRVTRFVDGIRPGEDPTLHFLHLLMPHVPYRLLPSGRTYGRPGLSFRVPMVVKGHVPNSPGIATVGKQRLLLQTVYSDRLIGELLDRLDATGLWDDAFVVVTADHGVGLEPRAGRRGMDALSGPDLARVPLFVKTPGQREGRVDERPVRAVDLVPTIADLVDIRVPWPVDGVSLLGPPRPAEEKGWHNLTAKRQEFDSGTWAARMRSGVAADVVTAAGHGPRGLFAIGPLGAIVGTPVTRLGTGPPSAFSARLAENIDVGKVDLDSGAVPAMLWGDVDAPPETLPPWLAVTVNGVVGGSVAVVTGTDGGAYFLGMIDDGLLRDGANEVTLHVVEGRTLRAVRWAG